MLFRNKKKLETSATRLVLGAGNGSTRCKGRTGHWWTVCFVRLAPYFGGMFQIARIIKYYFLWVFNRGATFAATDECYTSPYSIITKGYLAGKVGGRGLNNEKKISAAGNKERCV